MSRAWLLPEHVADVLPAEARRVEYPIFVPEWLETTKTSRMILNGAVQVPDPTGKPRTLLQRQELRIGIEAYFVG